MTGYQAFLAIIFLISSCKSADVVSGGTTSSASQKSQTNYGSSWDISTAFPGSGTYTGVTSSLLPSGVCSTKTILGVSGTVDCTSVTLQSNACRDPGSIVFPQFLDQNTTSSQLTQWAEVNTYAGSGGTPSLPSTGAFHYRDIPDVNKDDEGVSGLHVRYAPRPAVTCGTSGTITARIADCGSKNGANASWDGNINGNSGQGLWKLVTRAAANKEVWKDTRTNLIWSSQISNNANWCQASGNTQNAALTFQSIYHAPDSLMTGNGTIGTISGGSAQVNELITISFTSPTAFTVVGNGSGCDDGSGGAITAGGLTGSAGSSVTYGRANYCSFTLTQGSTPFASGDTFMMYSLAAAASCFPGSASGLQPATPISYCAEMAADVNTTVFDQTAGGLENWASGTYSQAKGYMGAQATDKVYWRLPTLNDYRQAMVDGLLFVMPDMGIAGSTRPSPDGSATTNNSNEWTATTGGYSNGATYYLTGGIPLAYGDVSTDTFGVRCVGR